MLVSITTTGLEDLAAVESAPKQTATLKTINKTPAKDTAFLMEIILISPLSFYAQPANFVDNNQFIKEKV